jgi:acyl-CoA synthetase (AMP-forming)/AMP-acid ligase II
MERKRQWQSRKAAQACHAMAEAISMWGPELTTREQVYYPILFLGIIAAGGIFAGTNPSYTTPELIHHIRTSHTKFLLVEPELLAPILEASQHPSISIPKSRIWLFDEHDSGAAEVTGQKTGRNLGLSLESWGTLLEKGESDWVRFDDLATSKKTTAARLYSSGTTGLPKAAVISHYNLVAQHTSVFEWRPRGWEVRLRQRCPSA